VEIVDGKHFIPCPVCEEKVKIVGRLSLKKHISSSHSNISRSWPCQLCRTSGILHKVYPSDVVNHMSRKHRINYRGPMAHPAWVPTDSSAEAFICPECRSYVYTRELKNHMKFYRLSTGRQMAYRCSLCPKIDRKIHVDDLQDHLKFLHGIVDEKLEKRKRVEQEEKANKEKKAEKRKKAEQEKMAAKKKKEDREKKSDTQKQLQSKDFMQCKGCPNQVRITNMRKHLSKCQGHPKPRPRPSHNKCDKAPAKPTTATNLDTTKPEVPHLMVTCIQCKGCRNQVKKINFVQHLEKCEGFRFCRGCNQRLLVQELPAHRNCGKITLLNVSEPQVPELMDDMAYSTSGAASVSSKGTPKAAVQINLLQKRESTQKESVDSDSPLLEKANEASTRTGHHTM